MSEAIANLVIALETCGKPEDEDDSEDGNTPGFMQQALPRDGG